LIRLIKPYISFAEIEEEFREVFDCGIFTKGNHVEAFRNAIKAYTGAQYAFLTTSATTALWLCLRVLGIQPGDEVIVSDFSFPATANVVEDLGATPVFADVDCETFTMPAEELERKITQKTKAVIFVDAFGNPTGAHTIKEICRKNHVPLIEDAACAIGSSENGVKCGNIADLTCFSFHPRKLVTTGEGGAITTNNADYARILERKLNHGAVRTDSAFDFIDFGYNFRLPELQAIMGIKQMEKLDTIIAGRNAIRDSYIKNLREAGLEAQKISGHAVSNIQSLVFKVPHGIGRDLLIAHLLKNNIESTIGTYCLSGTTYYKKKYKNIQKNALNLFNSLITLPCYETIDVEKVCEVIYAIGSS